MARQPAAALGAFVLAVTASFASVAEEAPVPPADLVLHGSLSGADNETYRLVRFDVPAGTSRITVDFDYTTRDARTTIDLGLLGPDGLRGWSGGNKRRFTISATDATPSYFAGPIDAGQWNLLLGIPNIRRDTQAEYTANVHFERDGRADANAEPVLRPDARWYRGDLHMHTAHSDGACANHHGVRVPCPLFLTAQTASERGLDFIAITDHNTVSHANAIRELQPYFDNLLLMPGREVTTFQGHANVFGTVAPIDFRVTSDAVPDWNALLANVARTGAALSINHPVRPSGEACMGCGWTPKVDIDYSRVQAVEAVNGLDAETPFSGIGFWQQLLNRGFHLTAIGGSDNHNAPLPATSADELSALRTAAAAAPEKFAELQKRNGAIGTPTTVIYADALSQAAIVAGLKRGRVFIDLAGTRERALDLSASTGKQTAEMGDTLLARTGATIRFRGKVDAVAGGEVQVIADGERVPWLQNARIESAAKSFEFQWRADGKSHWVRVDVRDDGGHLALLGNPIYLRGPTPGH
jgi:hypothetical protein